MGHRIPMASEVPCASNRAPATAVDRNVASCSGLGCLLTSEFPALDGPRREYPQRDMTFERALF